MKTVSPSSLYSFFSPSSSTAKSPFGRSSYFYGNHNREEGSRRWRGEVRRENEVDTLGRCTKICVEYNRHQKRIRMLVVCQLQISKILAKNWTTSPKSFPVYTHYTICTAHVTCMFISITWNVINTEQPNPMLKKGLAHYKERELGFCSCKYREIQ